MLELYHHGSSACAAKVRFALAEKHLAWMGHYVDILAGEQFDPKFVALNPKAVVPVLVHDGFVVTESTVICEYLDEVFPQRPLYPADPRERVAVRQWAKGVDEELHPACSALTYIVSHRHTILRHGAGRFEDFLAQGGSEGRAARERKWRWIEQGLAAPGALDYIRLYLSYLEKMDRALGESPWLAGHDLTMADVAMAPYVFRLESLTLDAFWSDGKLTAVADWYARLKSRPAFAAALEKWMPEDLAAEMRRNGARAWPEIEAMLESTDEPSVR
jgi:ganglioside-induced differentiation-associated protein 1